jgi:hypothetical protein
MKKNVYPLVNSISYFKVIEKEKNGCVNLG